MFKSVDELKTYVMENYEEVTSSRINQEHWNFQCSHCNVVRGFQVIKREVAISDGGEFYETYREDFAAPKTYLFRCPVCEGFKQWIVYELYIDKESGIGLVVRYFRVTSVPSDGLEDIAELPTNPHSLRRAYREAIRAKDANANLAAAAMFRRALQVITRDVLGARPSNLAKELIEVVGMSYNGITISANFASVGYIIKEAGNQGAHPDEDPDLLDFTNEDAEDLQHIFMELVSELFIVPAAARKAKQDFMDRRKVSLRAPSVKPHKP